MIRDLIVFNFHDERQSLREYIDNVFSAAKILEYEAGEEQLVDRILLNLHPAVLAHAAFLEKPRSRRQLASAVGMTEEKLSVLRERQKAQPVAVSSRNNPRDRDPPPPAGHRSLKCWNCGQPGHVRRECRRKTPPSGNGQAPVGHQARGREH